MHVLILINCKHCLLEAYSKVNDFSKKKYKKSESLAI